jgi:hypothetical protein
MESKREVYLLRLQDEDGDKILLREVGGEQSHTFESLEALLYYLRYKKKRVTDKDDKQAKKGVKP